MALAKNPVGASTFIEILSTCDVITPYVGNLRKSVNKAADKFLDLNKDQLSVNKKVVRNQIISCYQKNKNKNKTLPKYNATPPTTTHQKTKVFFPAW